MRPDRYSPVPTPDWTELLLVIGAHCFLLPLATLLIAALLTTGKMLLGMALLPLLSLALLLIGGYFLRGRCTRATRAPKKTYRKG